MVTLRVGEERGTRARIARHDPVDAVDAVAAELHLHDEAQREAERVVGL